MKKWQKRLRYLAISLLILGSIGWVGGFFIGTQLITVPEHVELPLGDLLGITVDSSGRIYCGLQSYGRVQVYDSGGAFIKGRSILSRGKAFRLRLDSNDHLHVATSMTEIHYVFNADGELLSQERDGGRHFEEFGAEGERRYQDIRTGAIYKVENETLFPRVVKIDRSGDVSLLVTTPFHLWLIMSPFPAWLFCVFGIISLGLSKRRGSSSKTSSKTMEEGH